MNSSSVRRTALALFSVAVAAILATPPQSAHAAERGWFLDAGYGVNRHRSDTISDASKNDKSTRLFAGYQVFRFLAFEAGLVDLNNKRFNTAGTELEVETHGYQAKLIGAIPLSGNDQTYNALFVSGGGWRWDIEANEGATRTRVHGVGPTASVGMILVGKRAAIKFEYERYMSKPKVDVNLFASDALDDEVKTDVLSINLVFFL